MICQCKLPLGVWGPDKKILIIREMIRGDSLVIYCAENPLQEKIPIGLHSKKMQNQILQSNTISHYAHSVRGLNNVKVSVKTRYIYLLPDPSRVLEGKAKMVAY